MAHVLANSVKLEVSEDKSRVRPRATPHASPVRMAQPDSTGAALVSVIESILNDANLCFDALLQACLSPPPHTPPYPPTPALPPFWLAWTPALLATPLAGFHH